MILKPVQAQRLVSLLLKPIISPNHVELSSAGQHMALIVRLYSEKVCGFLFKPAFKK